MASSEIFYCRGQEVHRKTGGADQFYLAPLKSFQGQDLIADALGFKLHAQGIGGQEFAGRIRLHAARDPIEQHRIELALEPRDLPADGGRGDVERSRGLGDRAPPHYFKKVAHPCFLQNPGVYHAVILFMVCRNGKRLFETLYLLQTSARLSMSLAFCGWTD